MGKLMKWALSLFYLSAFLVAILSQTFQCPSISRYNGSLEMADVCVCLAKQYKVLCRVKVYNMASFQLVSDYTDYLRRSLPYDRMYLRTFQLCLNVAYNSKDQLPLVRIGADLLSEFAFEHIIIDYCERPHVNPIRLELEPTFLEMQIETLHRLEIEIPAGVKSQDGQVLFNLAQALMPLKKLESLVLWMDARLHLHIPRRLFGQSSPLNYRVPLTSILFTKMNLHHQVLGKDDGPDGDNQVISIGSFAFLNLKRLQLITIEAAVVHELEAFAFAALYPMSTTLTINFTNCILTDTLFHENAFQALNRVATIFIDNANVLASNQAFIPSQNTFREFLLENRENKLVLDYTVNCRKREVYEKIKWMLDSQNRLSAKQIQLSCQNEESIFKYKFNFVNV